MVARTPTARKTTTEDRRTTTEVPRTITEAQRTTIEARRTIIEVKRMTIGDLPALIRIGNLAQHTNIQTSKPKDFPQ